MYRTAVLSADRRYRYRLGRHWAGGPRRLPWVMLNPSRADADVDDPTTRRVIAFSRAWGYDGCDIVNMCAWRSADPRELFRVPDPVGRDNTRFRRRAFADAVASGVDRVVVAWGAVPIDGRWLEPVISDVAHLGLTPMCLGATRAGAPRHPLYVSAVTAAEPAHLPL